MQPWDVCETYMHAPVQWRLGTFARACVSSYVLACM